MADFPEIYPLNMAYVYQDNKIFIRYYLIINTPDNNKLTYSNMVSTNGARERTHNYTSENGTPASPSIVTFKEMREEYNYPLVENVEFPEDATQAEISQGVIARLEQEYGADFKFTRTAAWLEAGRGKGVTSTISKSGTVIIT
jgi:hypothetical protein